MQNLTLKEVFSEGWRYTKENLGFLIGYIVTMFVVAIVFNAVADKVIEHGNKIVGNIINIVGTLVGIFLQMGLYQSALMITGWMKPGFNQMYSNARYLIPWFVAAILFDLMLVFGFILLILPGFYLLARYCLYPFFILDHNLGPIEALKAAAKASEGHRWFLFLFMVSIFLLNLLGALLLLVGLLFTIPLSMMALTVVYRKLTGIGEAENQPQEIVTTEN